MMNTATTENLTTAELERLRTLSSRIENARNFTASDKAIERLNAYMDRLIAKGRSVEQIITNTTAN